MQTQQAKTPRAKHQKSPTACKQTQAPADRLIKIGEVLKIVGVSKSTWYKLIRQQAAPAGVYVTPCTRRWSEQSCFAWVATRQVQNQLTLQS